MSPKMLPNETSDQDSKTIAGDETNPFSNMGFLKFWILSTFFYLTFPLSLLIAFLLLGPRRARQLVSALVHDILQTVLILIAVFALVAWGGYALVLSLLH